MKKKKILLFAETVTLAHLARTSVLAQLARDEYDVYLAASPVYDSLFNFNGIERVSLSSLTSEKFLERLAKGKPVYTKDELISYVEQDLQLIKNFAPDIVVGDFRISLYISAKVAEVPYIAVTNAYWSPKSESHYTVPELPFVKLLGAKLGQVIFNVARPIAFTLQAQAFNRVCKKYGVRPPGNNICHSYTASDLTLYADISEFYVNSNSIEVNQFIGPILWKPALPRPDWWDDIPQDKPLVYVSMGSSGSSGLLPTILSALESMNYVAIVSRAGAPYAHSIGKNCFFSDYLPGEDAVSLSDFVICNGGSPTTQQSLYFGKPVIGVPSNLDQYLNMDAVCRAGAGELIRSDDITEANVKRAVNHLIEKNAAENAQKISEIMKSYNTKSLFLQCVRTLLPVD